MQAVAAPADTAPMTRGFSSIAGATTSQKPACHQQRLPPPANTTCSSTPFLPTRPRPTAALHSLDARTPRRRPVTPLRILVTGGTFDKRYHAASGPPGLGGSPVPAIVERARPAGPACAQVS